MDYSIWYYIACFGFLSLGLLTHFLKKLVVARKDDEGINFKSYWIDHPYQSIISIIGGIVGFALMIEMGELSLLTSFFYGYIADSSIELIGRRKNINK